MTKLAEQIRQGADQAWESLSDGWRESSTRASGALTRFWLAPQSATPSAAAPQSLGPRSPGGPMAHSAKRLWQLPARCGLARGRPGQQDPGQLPRWCVAH